MQLQQAVERYIITPQTYKIFFTPQNKTDEIHLFMQFIDFFVNCYICVVVLMYICGRNLKR